MFQPCDYDVCAECADQVMAPSPQPARKSPFQGDLASIMLSPSRQTSAAVKNHAPIHEPVTSTLSPSYHHELALISDASRPKLFSIFVIPVPPPLMTHEMQFTAVAASPLRPTGRSRMRLRVSTPQHSMIEVHSLPQLLRPGRKIESPDCTLDSFASLAITTPPRVGFPGFAPKQLFPDSPISADKSVGTEAPLLVAANKSVSTEVSGFCEAGVQTSPRLDQPATLRDVRNELRALLVGLGF